MTLGLTAFFLVTLLSGGALLAVGLYRTWTARRETATEVETVAAAPALDATQLASDLIGRVEGLLAQQSQRQAEVLEDLKTDLRGLKSDVEWLAGERMIEQAISMAQNGLAAEEIGAELGLSRDAVETIATFRRH